VRKLKGLEDVLPVTVVHYEFGNKGWRFVTEDEQNKPPMTESEPLFGFKFLSEFYFKVDPNYDGKYTVPALWDTKHSTMVNNESSEIIVMLNDLFNDVAKHPEVDLYPANARFEIDEVAESFFQTVNRGVYRCGFAKVQEEYDEAVDALFDTLDSLESRLSTSRYLTGSKVTLADVRLFVTLIRFDAVYVQHYKTNKKQIMDYPNLSGYIKELYQMPAFKETTSFEHIKKLYFCSQPACNPLGIIPAGPSLAYLDEPHGRESL